MTVFILLVITSWTRKFNKKFFWEAIHDNAILSLVGCPSIWYRVHSCEHIIFFSNIAVEFKDYHKKKVLETMDVNKRVAPPEDKYLTNI